MCEINPAHKAIFRLELFTSDQRVSESVWKDMVNDAIMKAEIVINTTGRIRCHIHEVDEIQPPITENPA